MKIQPRRILIWLGIAVLFSSALGVTLAAPPGPQTPPQPPLAPPSTHSPDLTQTAGVELQLPPLKAVLLVGPIDGDDGAWTNEEKHNMDLAAQELQAHGVTVFKFYTPNNDWNQIKAAAAGAQFLFYRGHGVYWGSMPHPPVGGFALKNKFVSSNDIRNDLALAPNAIIMLYGCFTAGSAGNDTTSIDSAEAQRRVAQYSDPFLDIGAAAYYADWFDDAFQMYVRYLFQGKTMRQAYESFYDFNSATVERYTHPDHPDAVLWLDKDYWYDPKPQYNNAFVGQPDKTLTDLFQPTAMQISPSAITYMAEPAYPSRTFTLDVESTGADNFSWTAIISPSAVSWMSFSPTSGVSGQALTILITPTAAVGAHQTSLHITADAANIQNRAQSVPIKLLVVEQIYRVYLPLCTKQ